MKQITHSLVMIVVICAVMMIAAAALLAGISTGQAERSLRSATEQR